jgi:adenine-specific DNA-methyltransferase
MARVPKKPLAVATVQHKRARRPNNPTMELQSLLSAEEAAPETVMLARATSPATHPELYERNKALDPQLVWADGNDGQGAVQLAWRGKDEQDAEPLSVDAVPIYTAEKIHPKAIIDDIRRRAEANAPESDAPDLFADFNGIDEEDRLDFYHHTQKWTNRLILGDSLQVMASLAQKEDLRGKVQCIYFDPPYGIKFGSNWQVSTRKPKVQDGKSDDVSREPEQVKAFRDTWADGIHSYLSYLRDRLVTARELLTESGSIFLQISDENVHRVRAVLDEVFGSENFISQIILKTTSGAGSPSGGTVTLAGVHDLVLWYARSKPIIKYRQLYFEKADMDSAYLYRRVISMDGLDRLAAADELSGQRRLPEGEHLFRPDNLTSQSSPESATFKLSYQGQSIGPGKGGWKTNEVGMHRLAKSSRFYLTSSMSLQFQRRLSDFNVAPINDVWSDVGTGSFTAEKLYVVQTNTKIVQRCILMATDPGDLVLDPTCGSGTTAYVAEHWGRRWITIDTSRVALTLARTRLMGARYPWYALRDSEQGAIEERTLTLGRKLTEAEAAEARKGPFTNDIAHGLVLNRVPHITLKSIANNKAIDVIWDQWQGQLEPLRAALNAAAGTTWEEWQIPRAPIHPWAEKPAKAHAKLKPLIAERERMRSNWDRGDEEIDETDIVKQDKKIGKAVTELNRLLGRSYTFDTIPQHAGDPLPAAALEPHAAWWDARIARQKEIDASITANAEIEYLVDKPVELKGTVRVAGPFTVDSLSPHRVLPADEDDPMLLAALNDDDDAPETKRRPVRLATRNDDGDANDDFMRVVLDNLKVAGVGNTKKGERLRFTAIRPFAGRYVNAEGRYTEGESEGTPERRAAIFIGPEYDTVTRAMIVAAAKEAADIFDVLIVCGFAFEGHATSDTMTLGRLTVLKVNMNQDLRMGDRLKTADQGNLFVVFGEPDVVLRARADADYEVEIKGVDIFNPNTGEQKSSGKVEDDVACWFIDDDYDETSFFVRQAYFLGGKDPYEKLKTALKAELDEDAWSVLNSTVSRPFAAPSTGKIAVKVINHYGDEVMKVYAVAEARS